MSSSPKKRAGRIDPLEFGQRVFPARTNSAQPMSDLPEKCWLCGRGFETRIQWHHAVPKSKKGRTTVPVHPICHKAIHKTFTNAELARFGEDKARLLADEGIAKFVSWVATKPPDFHAKTR